MKKISLLLCVTIILSILASCTANVDVPEITIPSSSQTTTTEPSPENPPENPHVCIFSDWEIIKEATSTEDGLRERRCECGEVEQEVIKASNTEFVITYLGTKSVYPEQNGFDSRTDFELPLLEENGYKFLGWYNEEGNPVKYIPKGTNSNIILVAAWELIMYDITYDYGIKNSGYTPTNNNKEKYSIEDEIILSDPYWSGLIFTHWTDENGDEIVKIKRGTTGNLTITAHWTTRENIAYPSNSTNVESVFDDKTGLYYFIYKLGSIENVVLDSVVPEHAAYTKISNQGKELTITKTVSFEDTLAQSTTNSFAKSHSNSTTWSETNEKANSVAFGMTYELSLGFGIEDILSVDVQQKMGMSLETTNSWKHSETNGNATEDSSTASHSLTYAKESNVSTGTETTIKQTITSDLPNGHYEYVHVGIVKVYSIVIFDPVTNEYSVRTISVIDKVSDASMYYPDVSYMDKEMPALEFEHTEEVFEKIKQIYNSSYYVTYVGGEGTQGNMPTSKHPVNVDSNLPANTYTKTGYEFKGWNTKPDGSGTEYTNKDAVNNLAKNGQAITLYAMWDLSVYTASWNQGTGYNITVKRTSSPIGNGYLGNLNSGSSIYYGDVLSITYTNVYGYVITGNGKTSITVTGNVTDNDIFATVYAPTSTCFVEFSADNGHRDRDISNADDKYDEINTGFDVAELLEAGYSKAEITIRFDCCRRSLAEYSQIEMWIYANYKGNTDSEASYHNNNIPFPTNRDWGETKTITYTINLTDMLSGRLYIRWGGHGTGTNDWILGYTTVSVTAVK